MTSVIFCRHLLLRSCSLAIPALSTIACSGWTNALLPLLVLDPTRSNTTAFGAEYLYQYDNTAIATTPGKILNFRLIFYFIVQLSDSERFTAGGVMDDCEEDRRRSRRTAIGVFPVDKQSRVCSKMMTRGEGRLIIWSSS